MKSLTFLGVILFWGCRVWSQTDMFYKDIFYWTDTSTAYRDHRIVNLIENDKTIYALSKSMDADFQNPHPSFSRLTLQGQLKNFTVYSEVNDLNNVNALIALPNHDFRIYGTAISNRMFVPYINSVTPEGVMANSTTVMVNVPHYIGDAKQVSPNECVYTKSIQGSATHRYNAFVYRIELSQNDRMVWKCILNSEYNEEATNLEILPDTSVLLLCKRYTDETFMSWIPVIYKMDAKGTLTWTRELTDYPDFTLQHITGDLKNIYYTNANGSEESGLSKGNLIRLNPNGEVVQQVTVENLNPSGALILKSGKVLLYGGAYKADGRSFIKKGKVILYDNKLVKVKERVMGAYDKPDSMLPGMGATQNPTSSDFLTAIVLSNGRVALGGRVYMCLHHATSLEMITSEKANSNLLLIAGEDGTW